MNMLAGIKAVIFDLDGTLVDSMWMWKSIDKEYLGRFGLSVPPDLAGAIEGMGFSETARYFKERFQLEDSVEQIKKSWNELAWEKYKNQVPLKDGVEELLAYLRERRISMAIATSNSRELVEMVTRERKVDSYFSAILTSCDVARGKPFPDVYLMAAERIQARPEECLVFEDIVHGIMAGKSAGMKVCAVEDLYSKAQEEKKRELADYYIVSYREILEHV